MTQKKITVDIEELKALLITDSDFLKPLITRALQEILEAEMDEILGAGKYERTVDRVKMISFIRSHNRRKQASCSYRYSWQIWITPGSTICGSTLLRNVHRALDYFGGGGIILALALW